MPAKKPAKPTRLQVKADKKDKVLTGPKGSKPQSTTTNRVRTQGGTTMSKPKPKPAAKPKPAPKKPSVPSGGKNLFGGAGSKATAIKDAGPRAPKPEFKTNRTPFSQAKPAAKPSGGRPALPPGRQGGALTTRQSSGSRPAARPPARSGRPALPPGRPGGALAIRPRMGRGPGALVATLGMAAADQIGFKAGQAIGSSIRRASEPKVTGSRTGRTGRGGTTADVGGNPAKDGRYIPGSQQVKFNQAKPKPKPKPSSGTTRASAPSRSSAPARPASRPASRPAASSAPKPPAVSSAPKPPKMPAAQSSFGPVKSSEEYGRMIGAPKPPSSSSSAPTPKKKSSALTQAEIRKRRFNR